MSHPSHATASGRAYLRLRALARAQGRATAEYFQLFALEGFAARLAESAHRDHLVLKGGLLMAAFDHRRPTRDVDLLAIDLDIDERAVREVVRGVASLEIDDGLRVEADSIRSGAIREGDRYSGVRVSLRTTLATANISFHVDVNVGDPVVPNPEMTALPRLLGGEPICLLGYPVEMVIAEKLVTAFERGGANTRWRDFVDLHLLLGSSEFEMTAAARALSRVASHRAVTLGPFGSVRRSLEGHAEQRWRAWRRKQGLQSRAPAGLGELLGAIESASDPLLTAAASGASTGPAGGPALAGGGRSEPDDPPGS